MGLMINSVLGSFIAGYAFHGLLEAISSTATAWYSIGLIIGLFYMVINIYLFHCQQLSLD
ncbi:MAG: hypothetical protein COV29_00080 [Candidatus Yanofskybacteria bacterium CG10_big_fil_rev_8_21_14_0_10_36_16]|uniref:Uncharacterized protein n=1 Tax=Candidatus Yanofskybacteria bacterium CG10_big_fil_rev_8_21_14_0_10_36_16 TaxID=1975096 RepID=A0A2J0Q8G6_9BACT|nr:MAG: hypothetical protein COV29_00080 [Candidatus Yanofskybacteria bacterium CG10_big_fil_rev_8_21_14_0_10_36_16]